MITQPLCMRCIHHIAGSNEWCGAYCSVCVCVGVCVCVWVTITNWDIHTHTHSHIITLFKVVLYHVYVC